MLLIEDDGATTRDLSNRLENEFGCEIKHAYSYSSAIGLWEKYNGHFNCIVLDLNINPTGLDVVRLNKYDSLIGMAFLDDICDGKTEDEIKKIWKKIVIYSGYIKELKNKEREFGWQLKFLKLISKDTSGISKLLESINQIIKLPHTPTMKEFHA